MNTSLQNFTQIGSEQWKVQMNFHAEGEHIVTANSLVAYSHRSDDDDDDDNNTNIERTPR
jgi:hypothetical protein